MILKAHAFKHTKHSSHYYCISFSVHTDQNLNKANLFHP